jgi:anti-sigma factor RsiW
MNGAHAAAHLDDGDLIRYLDGEGSEAERIGWERHVDACEQCARRTAEAEAQSRQFSRWLARAAFEEDLPDRVDRPGDDGVLTLEPASRGARRSGWSPWLKAAAAIALVAGPLAAIPPLRGWVVDRVAPPAEEAAVTTMDATAPVTHPIVRFVPEPGVFTVRVEGGGGSLAVGRAAGDTAELSLSGEAPDAVVAATSVRLRSLEPDTRHTLLLPDYVTGIRVFVGERAMVLEGAALDRGEVIPLN